jgi:hypothetical protein
MGQPLDDAIARRVLTIVTDPATQPAGQTAGVIATNTEISDIQGLRTRLALAEIDPPVVHRKHDARFDIECWSAIEPGVSAWLDDAQVDESIR